MFVKSVLLFIFKSAVVEDIIPLKSTNSPRTVTLSPFNLIIELSISTDTILFILNALSVDIKLHPDITGCGRNVVGVMVILFKFTISLVDNTLSVAIVKCELHFTSVALRAVIVFVCKLFEVEVPATVIAFAVVVCAVSASVVPLRVPIVLVDKDPHATLNPLAIGAVKLSVSPELGVPKLFVIIVDDCT